MVVGCFGTSDGGAAAKGVRSIVVAPFIGGPFLPVGALIFDESTMTATAPAAPFRRSHRSPATHCNRSNPSSSPTSVSASRSPSSDAQDGRVDGPRRSEAVSELKSDVAHISTWAPFILAAVPSAALVLSVSYELGRFSFFGLIFLTFFSIQDYLSNAILWLPFGAIGVFAYATLLSYFLTRAVRLNNNLIFRGKDQRVLIVICVFLIIIAILTGGYVFSISLLLAVLWVEFAFFFLRIKGGNDWPLMVDLFFAVLPSVFIFVFGWSYADAERLARTAIYDFALETTEHRTAAATIISKTDSGLIYLNQVDRTISILNWEQVGQIEKPLPSRLDYSAACLFFEACRGIPIAKNGSLHNAPIEGGQK